jgi:hypothetical protein
VDSCASPYFIADKTEIRRGGGGGRGIKKNDRGGEFNYDIL